MDFAVRLNAQEIQFCSRADMTPCRCYTAPINGRSLSWWRPCGNNRPSRAAVIVAEHDDHAVGTRDRYAVGSRRLSHRPIPGPGSKSENPIVINLIFRFVISPVPWGIPSRATDVRIKLYQVRAYVNLATVNLATQGIPRQIRPHSFDRMNGLCYSCAGLSTGVERWLTVLL